MKKRLVIGAILLAIGSAVAGYLDCNRCGCSSFYNKYGGISCDKCGHAFSNHRR